MIAVDMDGCVTDFIGGFTRRLQYYLPEAPIKSHPDATAWAFQDWYWPEFTDRPKLKEAEEVVWSDIFDSPYFWERLPPLYTNQLGILEEHKRDIVFMTRRDGIYPWLQTVRWLEEHGVHEPLVIRIASGEEKHDVMTAMGIHVLVDDAPKFIEPAVKHGCAVVVVRHPYNEHLRSDHISHTNGLEEAVTVALRIAADVNW